MKGVKPMFYHPPGRYNLNYDICAILLDIAISIFFLMKRRAKDRRTALFLILEGILIVSALAEVGTSMYRNGTVEFSDSMTTFVTIVAHYVHNSLGLVTLLYVLEILGRLRMMKKSDFVIISIPQLVLTVFMAVPQLRWTLFYYDAQGYHRGIFHDLYYLMIGVYVIEGIINILKHHKAVFFKDLVYSLFVAAGFVLSMLAQAFNPYLRSCIFLQSLCMLAVYVTIENDDETFDYETGLLSGYSLRKEARFLFDDDVKSHIISVRISNNEYYNEILGTEIARGIVKQMSAWMARLSTDRIKVYAIGNWSIAVEIFDGTQEEALSLSEKIKDRFNDGWIYRNTTIYFQTQVILGRIPEVIKTENQLATFVEGGYDVSLPYDRVIMADDLIKSDIRKADVEKALRRTLDKNAFMVYYQPIYDTQKKRICSCEALVRMNDSELGFVSPEEFIKVAEHTGMVSQIDEMVFDKVCRFIHDEKPEQYGLDYIEVNLSTIQCMDTNLPERYRSIMDRYGVKASQISLEITESAVINDEETMRNVVNSLINMGFSLALDDFGTGNSNFSYITSYPFHLIKIDKSFLWGADKSSVDAAILRHMIDLITELSRQAVVEGVETAQHRDKLIKMGTRYLQGYYYSKPIPEKEFIKYIKDFNQE